MSRDHQNMKSHDQDVKRAKALAWHPSFCIKWTYLREKGEKSPELMYMYFYLLYLRNDMKKTELQTSDTDQFSNSSNSHNIYYIIFF